MVRCYPHLNLDERRKLREESVWEPFTSNSVSQNNAR